MNRFPVSRNNPFKISLAAHRERFELPAILSAFVILALGYSLTLPLGESPDEVSHHGYVTELIMHNHMPDVSGPASGEASQPPIYYALAAAFTAWVPQVEHDVIANPDFSFSSGSPPNLLLHPRSEAFPYRESALAWHLMRVVSVALGAVTVWSAYQIARELFPADRSIAIGTAGFIAFLPSFLFVSAAVTNDNLMIALAALTLLQWTRMFKRTPNHADAIRLGVLLGFAPQAKGTGFLLWAMSVIGLVFLARAHDTRMQWICSGVVAFMVAGLLLTPWAIYTTMVYNDPFAWNRFNDVAPRLEPFTWNDAHLYVTRIYKGFWGRFGGAAHIEFPDLTYAAFGGVLFLGMLGLIVRRRDWYSTHIPATTRHVMGLFVFLIFVLLAAQIRLLMFNLAADQARQVFSGLIPLCLLLVFGITRLVPAKGRGPALCILVGGMASVAIATLIFVYATYAPPVQSLNALPPLDQRAPSDFANQIRIVDYRIEPTRVAPGNSIAAQIYWQALRIPDENYWLLLQLVDKNDAIVNRDGVPSAGRATTDWWQKSQVFSSRHSLSVPEDLSPGVYTLRLGLHPYGRWEWLPVNGKEMLVLGNIVVENAR